MDSISYQRGCRTCTIALTHIASLGGARDTFLLAPAGGVSTDRLGRFFAIGFGGDRVGVYDSTGRFLTAFGRRGDGPGEFGGRGARFILVGRADTVLVVDSGRRVSIFSPDLRYVRTVVLPAIPRAVGMLKTGNIVISASLNTSSLVGLPLHEIDGTGRVLRSFGAARAELRPGRNTSTVLQFAVSGDGSSVWIPGGYGAQEFSPDGQKRSDFTVFGVPWLAAVTRESVDTVVNGERRILGMASASVSFGGSDASGLLWFNAVLVPPSFTMDDMIAGRRPDITYRVEAIDPRSLQLIVSEPHATGMRIIPGTSLAYTVNVDGDGIRKLDVWRISVHGRQPAR